QGGRVDRTGTHARRGDRRDRPDRRGNHHGAGAAGALAPRGRRAADHRSRLRSPIRPEPPRAGVAPDGPPADGGVVRRALPLALVALVVAGCGGSHRSLGGAAAYVPSDAEAFISFRTGPNWQQFARLVLGRVPRVAPGT